MNEKVVHCKKDKHDVYIGRGSKWGNPFVMNSEEDRDKVIADYEKYILEKIKEDPIKYNLSELEGKTLGCYCAPKKCHGDDLVKLINAKPSNKTFNIIVAGTRTFNDYDLLEKTLDYLLKNKDSFTVICGEANGADKLGKRYAVSHSQSVRSFPAEWDKYGKSAGYKRNDQMAEVADAVVCFYDGTSKGTKHMIDIAKSKGIPLRIVFYNLNPVHIERG